MEKNKRGGLWTFEEIVAFGFDKIIGNSKVIENFANTVYHHEQNSLEIYVHENGDDGIYGISQPFRQLKCTISNIRERGTGIYFWDSLDHFISEKTQFEKKLNDDSFKRFGVAEGD
jgi:hypothetical protein